MLNNKRILVTGGTGSFGTRFISRVLQDYDPSAVIVYSRDELKQFEMQQKFPGEHRIRYFIGDVRDERRMMEAMEGVDYVVHAAALKQVPAAEYNPIECIRTNITGAENVTRAAIANNVKKVVALSTDKAAKPINLYGATKLVSDKLFVSANNTVGSRDTRFCVVRYGNVMGSRGSVIPLFQKQAASGVVTLTDRRMTRFWLSLDSAVDLVLHAVAEMQGGEIFVPKIPSMRIVDLARAIAPTARIEEVGRRPGEKLHEVLLTAEESRNTTDCGRHYVVRPDSGSMPASTVAGRALPDGFAYSSDSNDDWMSVSDLRAFVADQLPAAGPAPAPGNGAAAVSETP